jgi:uncharacterized integral membrane protein (TIGR00698 family)
MIVAARDAWPGLAAAGTATLAAQFLSDHYGAPAMLMALLLGIALNPLSEAPRFGPGIAAGGREVLRLGVALLGLRIGWDLAASLGAEVLALVVAGVAVTIGAGLALGRFFGFRMRFSFLSGGSVAICGASAAMAIAAILPKDERSEERLAFTVVTVTVLSTIAMVLYPILAAAIGFDERTAGIFIGATIHDVAQVVGAGFSVSEATGETATLVKLVRVTLLAPVVLVAGVILRHGQVGGERPPLIPGFVAAFLGLAIVNSLGVVPSAITTLAADISRWALLTAVAAVGMRTSLRQLGEVGPAAVALVATETLILAAFVACALWLL